MFRSLPKESVKVLVEFGCPDLICKSVNLVKRLRQLLQLEEANACGACSLRGSCDEAYCISSRRTGSSHSGCDSWTPEQLNMMVFGGNNRAHAFFKQHGWTDGGKIEAKYTSRAAELYKQLLTKEVAKSSTTDSGLPSSPVSSPHSPQAINGFPELKLTDSSKENSNEPEITRSPKAPVQSAILSSVKKPIGGKKIGGKTGGLGVRKLTTKPNESLYDQKPEEPAPVVPLPTSSMTIQGSSFPSHFEYVDDTLSAGRSSGSQVTGHVAPPKFSSFFSDFGMDSGFQKKANSNSSKAQVDLHGSKCHSLNCDSLEVLAEATIIDTNLKGICHFQSIGRYFYKILVIEVFNKDYEVPVPTSEIDKLGEAIGTMIKWPRNNIKLI